jgi:hypothetical protein
VAGRVAEPDDDAPRVGAPADRRVGRQAVQRVELRLREVAPPLAAQAAIAAVTSAVFVVGESWCWNAKTSFGKSL